MRLDHVSESLTEQLREHFKTKEAEQEIVAKYKIKVQKGGLWEPNDIKKVWGKIQRMRTRESRRIPWIFVTLSKCRKWEMKQQIDNNDRDKIVMEGKLKGLQERCQELKAQLENEQKAKPADANVQNLQSIDQNQFPVLSQPNTYDAGSDTEKTTDTDSDTDDSGRAKATAMLRPLRINVKKGKTRTEVYLQKTKEGNVLMDREIRDSDVVQYKYSPPTSKEVYEWSKEVGNVRKDPRSALARLEALREIFSLSVKDGFSIVSVNLSSTDRKSLKEALGESLSGDRLTDDRTEREGWKKLKAWCRKAQQQKVDWNEITRCKQKTDESVEDYTERLCETFSLYSGLDVGCEPSCFVKIPGKGGPFLSVWLNGLIPEIRKGVCNRKEGLGFPTDCSFTVEELLVTARDVARAETQASKLVRVLFTDPGSSNDTQRKSGAVPKVNQTFTSDICWRCGKTGHTTKRCRKKGKGPNQRLNAFLPLPPPPAVTSDPVTQFSQLSLETQQRLLSAVPVAPAAAGAETQQFQGN